MTSPNKVDIYKLPEHYSTRPLSLDDAETIAEFITTTSQAKGYHQKADPNLYRSDWQEPNFNLENSSIVVENDGEILGYAILWDNSVVPVKPWCAWAVQHDLYETDLVPYLLNWLEDKAQRAVEKCSPKLRVTLQTNALEGYERRINDLNNAGFKHARNFYRMLIEMESAPPEPQLPENFTIRGMKYPDELEAVVRAVELGFKDHWGFVEEPFEEALKYWKHYTETDELFDPELYVIVIDNETKEIAGITLCRIEQFGKPETAYIDDLAVLPNYRRQGLALAMLQYIFGAVYKRGRDKVALHVDADSLTNATRLYTKAGMQPVETWSNYQKVLRDGLDISTTSVE